MHLKTRSTCGLLVWMALAGGCEPDVLVADKEPILEEPAEPVDTEVEVVLEARLEVTPRMIDFGYVEEGQAVDGLFTLSNVGTGPLDISSLAIAGSPAFEITQGADMTIAPGASETLTVTYTSVAEDASSVVSFVSTDPGLPAMDLDVYGTGANPLLLGDPLDFGMVLVGETSTRSLPLYNPGNAPVTVFRITSDDPHFVPDLPAPLMIDPGQTANVDVTFAPLDAVDYVGTLLMDSDARVIPDAVDVIGTGGSTPIAVCEADPPIVTALRDSFFFDGTGSSDPTGRPITAQWQLLSVPGGSNVVLPSTTSPRVGPITPDVVGDYTAQLVITNDLGVSSEPCVATATAEADADLWIEMTWQHAEDIDLHLIRDGGSFESNSDDCHFRNCRNGLSWDAPGTADDPYLDVDDVSGTGPENINMSSPASTRYRVVIHDWNDSRHSGVTNDVRIKVFVGGILAHDSTHTTYNEGDVIDVVEIDWTVTPPVLTPL